jgi:hypothetical protein
VYPSSRKIAKPKPGSRQQSSADSIKPAHIAGFFVSDRDRKSVIAARQLPPHRIERAETAAISSVTKYLI